MSQQQHDMYIDYSAPPNRSPESSRPYGGAGGFQSGLSLPRQTQRPFDPPVGSSGLYPQDRLGAGYNQRGMDQMPQQGGMPGGYMGDNGQPWAYNPAGVATVNGAMNGTSRQRSVNRRVPIPTVSTTHSFPQYSHSPREYWPRVGLTNLPGIAELDRPRKHGNALRHAWKPHGERYAIQLGPA